jgi:hypothetical protein
MSTDEHFVASAAHYTGLRHVALSSFAARKAGHGNDRVWKAWKAMKPASHPSHTLWKSLRDSHIPTASTTGYMFPMPVNSTHRHRKGLVTDVSGPQRNACPGTLTPLRGLAVAFRVGVAGRNEGVTKPAAAGGQGKGRRLPDRTDVP